MYGLRRKLYSQNFFHNRKLVAQLVGRSSVASNDLVLEIGPGKGIITQELLKKARRVVAVEIDHKLVEDLKKNLREPNLELHWGDFLRFSLPKTPYKVFANIPFSIEGKIIHKLLESENSPEDCYLVVMDELAHRLAAPKANTLFSIMHQPWYDFSINYRFRSTDFVPVPNINSVLFRFVKKQQPLLPYSLRNKYQAFVQLGFMNGVAVRQNLRKKYALAQVDQAFQRLSIARKSKPSQLPLEKWVRLFREITT